jgi:hypothetical protein
VQLEITFIPFKMGSCVSRYAPVKAQWTVFAKNNQAEEFYITYTG